MRFHKINTRMCRVGDDLYLVDNKRLTPETAKNLLTYDIDTDSFSLVNSFASEVWTADGGRVWGNGYMSLQEQDGYLYMNTANKVLVYDTETSEMSLFAENTYNKQFFGLCLEDGRLYAVLADSPNETGRLQYVGDGRLPGARETDDHPADNDRADNDSADNNPDDDDPADDSADDDPADDDSANDDPADDDSANDDSTDDGSDDGACQGRYRR